MASLTPADGGRWVVGGVLDFETVPKIWPALDALLEETSDGQLTLSLAGVNQANSAGLVMLLEARDRARQLNCRLDLVHVPQELHDLASVSQCEALIAEG
ncbi:MAG: STAS domain-containing protein [Chromatiaceae bacterium]|jgi:phospholipid transport system transporter-binding protein